MGSAAQIDIAIDSQQTSIVLQEYPNVAGRIQVRSMNRAIVATRTLMAKEMARDTGLKSADIKDALRTRQASLSNPTAQLATSSLKRIPLIKFNPRGSEPSRGKGRGVSYRLGGETRRLPSAFIATMPSGHRGVFGRRGKSRLPIDERYGPSLGRVFAKFRPAGLARAQEILDKNLAHELERATEMIRAGVKADENLEVALDDVGTD